MSLHFVLQREGWGYDDLYEAIKVGLKTSEFRKGIDHWRKRLLTKPGVLFLEAEERAHKLQDESTSYEAFTLTIPDKYIKHKRARFVVGYTKVPMLTSDVTGILYHFDGEQFEVKLANVEEVK